MTTEFMLQLEKQERKNLSQTTACMEHEMKTPLKTIVAMLDMMFAKKVPENKQTEILRTIRLSASMIHFSIMHKLDLQQIEAGTF